MGDHTITIAHSRRAGERAACCPVVSIETVSNKFGEEKNIRHTIYIHFAHTTQPRNKNTIEKRK
jgi:hypothetical protein